MFNNEDYEALLHEIKNAVSVVSCSLQLIEKQHPEVHDFAFWQDSTSDLANLRALLVEVSNMRLGDHPKKQLVPLDKFFEEVKASCPKANSSKQPLIIEIEEGLSEGFFDAFRIKHALLRVLDNAFDALYDDGSVFLCAKTAKDGILIQVRDNGHGIAEDALPAIFQPFFGTGNGKQGLGLPIAKAIVDGHGGTLTIESALAKGTTINIFLPNE